MSQAIERMHALIRNSEPSAGDRSNVLCALEPELVPQLDDVCVTFISVTSDMEGSFTAGIYAAVNVPLDEYVLDAEMQYVVASYIGKRMLKGVESISIPGLANVATDINVEESRYQYEDEGIRYPILAITGISLDEGSFVYSNN